MKHLFKIIIAGAMLLPVSITLVGQEKVLPRSSAQKERVDLKKVQSFLEAAKVAKQEIHSLMIVRHGKVVYEEWFEDNTAEKPHVMNSVSKTFTAMAVGFAVDEGLLKVNEKVISFFPDKLPDTISQNLRDMTVKDLLTMSSGSLESEINARRKNDTVDWVQAFLSVPVVNKPGMVYEYSSMSTYMLSAIVQKLTGQRIIDYLTPRLFDPLGIKDAKWLESPQGINTGGWGLYVKTEDMAKLGQLLLQKGLWNEVPIISAAWIKEASSYQVASVPSGAKIDNLTKELSEGDWTQGYGYQIWRCRYGAFRADGAGGQFIIVLPKKDAVVVTTANVQDMQAELNLIWKYLLPALK